jgi:hypothetical protein
MYPDTNMYLGDRSVDKRRNQAPYWGRARGVRDRLLLVVGAVALLLLIPVLWIDLLYSGRFGDDLVYAGGVALCALAAGIGFALIRILDGGR